MQIISEVWAYVSHDKEGEGIVAFLSVDRMWIPMVAADEARVKELRPMALDIVKKEGKPIKLVRFDNRTEIETLNP